MDSVLRCTIRVDRTISRSQQTGPPQKYLDSLSNRMELRTRHGSAGNKNHIPTLIEFILEQSDRLPHTTFGPIPHYCATDSPAYRETEPIMLQCVGKHIKDQQWMSPREAFFPSPSKIGVCA